VISAAPHVEAGARGTTEAVSLLRQAGAVAWKDLRVELRSREIVYTMAFFATLLVVVFSFVFPSDPRLARVAAPGMLWVAIAFAGTIGLGRAFDRERENDTMRALLLAPVPRLAVFLGKSVAIAGLVLAVSAVCVPLMTLFLGAPLFAEPLPLVIVLVLGAIGFAIVGTVFAATMLKARSRDVLLPVVLYPLLVPLFVAGTRVTAEILAIRPDPDVIWYWIGFLGIYDAVFLVLSLWIFESLVIE
jgi:heme exporter protein B